MTSTTPYQIFLASPGGLEPERAAVKRCVDEWNRRSRAKFALTYQVVDCSNVRGTARRPQEAINELIEESHFLVLLFRDKWGSSPNSPWDYSSGTEEELFTALLALGQNEQPMRDVWVSFLHTNSPDENVQRLRDHMTEEGSLTYESVSDSPDLKAKLDQRLTRWAQEATRRKHATSVHLTPLSGKEVLKAASLRLLGEQQVRDNQLTPGRDNLREASILGGPDEGLAYARFLARQNEMPAAIEEAQRVIDYFDGHPTRSRTIGTAEAYAMMAGLRRRERKHTAARTLFVSALQRVHGDEDSSAYEQVLRARILDNLGLTHQSLNNEEKAREAFMESLTIRRRLAGTSDIAQSLVNLARVEVKANHPDKAYEYADEAVSSLEAADLLFDVYANAETALAKALALQGRAAEGIAHAESAVAVNRTISHQRGLAISLLQLAYCCMATEGRSDDAIGHATECLELNQRSGDEHGTKKAQWILDTLAAATPT